MTSGDYSEMRLTTMLAALTCTLACTLLHASKELAHVRMAHKYPGIDAGQKISSAIEDLPRGGGLVDASGLTGPQRLSRVTIPAGVTVKLPPITFTVIETVFVRPSGHLIGSAWGNPGHTNLVAGRTLQGDLVHARSESPLTGGTMAASRTSDFAATRGRAGPRIASPWIAWERQACCEICI